MIEDVGLNLYMFINDWNGDVPTIQMAKTYGLKTVAKVNYMVWKLRNEGYDLKRKREYRTHHTKEREND